MSALARYDQEQPASLSRIYAFQAALTAPEWSEQVRRMKGGGRYRFAFAPYQREMMETPFRSDVQMTAYMLATRMGKTEVSLNVIGHAIAEAPRRILHLWPTIKQAELHSKETLDTELLEPTPCLQHMIRGGRRDTSNTILHKLFPGGLLTMLGANASDIARSKGNLLIADEIDKIDSKVGDEGDQLKILWMRGSEYPDCVKIACSYPSIKGQSKIADLMETSDFRKYFTPCAKCGEPIILLREHIKHPEGEPEKAEIEAPCCGRMITDDQRREMVRSPDAEWRATKPFNGIAGFWGNGCLSPHPVQKGYKSHLHWIAQEAISAELADNPDRARQVIVTKFDAVPFTPERLEAPEPDALYKRRERYKAREKLPGGVLLVTAGVDVQKEWLEVSVWGWGQNKESWQLEHEKITGSYDDPRTWEKLDKYLADLQFKHPLGVEIGLRAAFVDAGKWGTTVFAWTHGKGRRNIYASEGSPTINCPILKKYRLEGVKGTGKKVRVYSIGVNQAKDVIYHRLGIGQPPQGKEAPVGYVHFNNQLPQSYFEGLTCEYGKEERFRGEVLTRYVNPPGRRNEPLDTYVYAFAATKLVSKPFGRLRAELEQRAKKENAETQTSKGSYISNFGNDYL